MKVIAFVNGRVGAEGLRAVVAEPGSDLVAMVIHPEERRRFGAEIIEASGLSEDRILQADEVRAGGEALQRLREFDADMGVSLLYGYILSKEVLGLFPQGCLNLHPALLPYNRGAHPNVWSLVDGTPAGVTLHLLDEGIDTGPIVVQREVPKLSTDTGEDLHLRQEEACIELFREVWPSVVASDYSTHPQDPAQGTGHRVRDLKSLDEIDLDQKITARELIDRLRARTFPPHDGCYFIEGGKKVFVRVSLEAEDDRDDRS